MAAKAGRTTYRRKTTDKNMMDTDWHRILTRAGLHHPCLPHASFPNSSDRPRRVIILRYTRANEPMTAGTLINPLTGTRFVRQRHKFQNRSTTRRRKHRKVEEFSKFKRSRLNKNWIDNDFNNISFMWSSHLCGEFHLCDHLIYVVDDTIRGCAKMNVWM